jgi:hypothetical protein
VKDGEPDYIGNTVSTVFLLLALGAAFALGIRAVGKFEQLRNDVDQLKEAQQKEKP